MPLRHAFMLEKARLNQIQYKAAKLCTGALHFSSQSKLETNLAWETLQDRAEFLGLSFFHKIVLGETRPLVGTLMPKLRLDFNSRQSKNGCFELFPPLGTNFSNSFFPHFTKSWNDQENTLKGETDILVYKSTLKTKIKLTVNSFKGGAKPFKFS